MTRRLGRRSDGLGRPEHIDGTADRERADDGGREDARLAGQCREPPRRQQVATLIRVVDLDEGGLEHAIRQLVDAVSQVGVQPVLEWA